jgi:hypothetical protein
LRRFLSRTANRISDQVASVRSGELVDRSGELGRRRLVALPLAVEDEEASFGERREDVPR